MINTVIVSTHNDRAFRLRKEHGKIGTYVEHLDLPGRPLAIMVACQCPGGHGVAGLPVKFWLSKEDAALDLVRATPTVVTLPVPASCPLPAAA